MTDTLDALLARLDLPASLAPLDERAGPSSHAAVAEAIGTALRRLRLPEGAPLSPEAAPRVAAATARVLLQMSRPAEALHVTRHGHPDWAGREEHVLARCQALFLAGSADEMAAELDAIPAGEPALAGAAARLRGALRTPAVATTLSAPSDRHEAIWGPIVPDLSEKVAALAALDPTGACLPEGFVAGLHALRSDGMPLDEFRHRLAFGRLAHSYMTFLLWCAAAPSAATPAWRRAAAASLAGQIDGLTPIGGAEILRAAEERGRSVVFALSHTGAIIASRLGARASRLPHSFVAVRVPASEPAAFHVSTSGAGTAQQFLRLLKAMRREPRAVSIFPDATNGDTVEVEVLGRPVRLGRGAATLAFHAGAATVSARSRWTGRSFAVEIIAGPVADGQSKAEFEDEFHRFYADRLADVLTGPPEDMAPFGGVFPAFAPRRESPA